MEIVNVPVAKFAEIKYLYHETPPKRDADDSQAIPKLHIYSCFSQVSRAGFIEELLLMRGFSPLDRTVPFPTFLTHLRQKGLRNCIISASTCAAFLPSPARSVDLFLLYLELGCESTFGNGDGLTVGVCLSIVAIVVSMKSFTDWSSWVSDLISGRGSIAVCIIFPIFSQSTRSYALRGFFSGFSFGWMFHSENVAR